MNGGFSALGSSTSYVKRAIGDITFPEDGYLIAYVSFEKSNNHRAHFDDFLVTHKRSTVVHEDDYYPFGMTFNSFSSGTENLYKYNGKEEQKETGWLDYGARMYMSDLGRFTAIDPWSEKYNDQGVYNYAFNNPVRFTDFMGLGPEDEVDTDPEDTKKAAKEAVKHVEGLDKEHGKVNRCNQGVACAVEELTGNTELGDKNNHVSANEQGKRLAESDSYERVDIYDAQGLANAGEVVIISQIANDPNESGHIGLVTPSEAEDDAYSPSLGKDVPFVMNTGKVRTTKQKLSESFSVKDITDGNVKAYRFVGNPGSQLKSVTVKDNSIPIKKPFTSIK